MTSITDMDSELNNVNLLTEKKVKQLDEKFKNGVNQESLKKDLLNSEPNILFKNNREKIEKNNAKIDSESKSKLNNENFSDAQNTNLGNNLPDTVKLLETPEGSKCFLVGTVHFSVESQNDVSKVIQAVQPHIIVVELCSDRIHVLQLDEETILKEAKDLSFNKILDIVKQNGLYRGLFYVLLLDLSARITKVLGLAPGGEFRRALAEAKNLNPNPDVALGDRSIKVTFGRALRALSWWQTCKLAWQLLTMKDNINHEEVEKCKSPDALEEMMLALAEEYPALEQVFVKERDIFLTYSMQNACKPFYYNGKIVPKTVVGIVGIGHMPGIIENWGKIKESQIPPIMTIPPPSLSSKVLKITFKVSLLIAVAYTGYKLVPISTRAVCWLKSSANKLGEKILK